MFWMFTVGVRPVTATDVVLAATSIASLPVVALTIGCAVAGAAAERGGEVGVDGRDVGAGQVVDRDRVRAAEGVEVDLLHACGVHRDGALDAEELEPVAVRGQVDLLSAVGTVEHHRVGAVLALDCVAAVARIPDEAVVAGTEERGVVAPVAVNGVVSVAAHEGLVPFPASDGVVPVPAVEARRDGVGEDAVAFVDPQEVVSGLAVELDRRDRRAIEAELGRAVVAHVDLENVGVAGREANRDLLARLRAVDRQRAVLELGLHRLRCTGLSGECRGSDGGHENRRQGRQPFWE
jgi:hypothetical protein